MILADVRAILQAGNIGWHIFENQIPSNRDFPPPDDLVALFIYPGAPPEHVKGVAVPVRRSPRFQVLCRSKSYPNAYAKAEQVFGLLAGYSGLTSGGEGLGIRALSEAFPLPNDGAHARVATNFEATVT